MVKRFICGDTMGDGETFKFKIVEGKIVCGGKTYEQFIIRHVDLEANGLSACRSYSNEFVELDEQGMPLKRGLVDHSTIFSRTFDLTQSRVRHFIKGKADLENDTISIIGDPDRKTKQLSLTLEELMEDSQDFARFAWKAQFFFFPFDWEVGRDDEWALSICLPSTVFQALIADIETGRQRNFSIRIDTDLWVEEHDRHMPPSGNVTWYLGPNKNGRTDRMPETADGVVDIFGWSGEVIKALDEPTSSEKSQRNVNFKELINAIYLLVGAMFFFAVIVYWRH